MGRKGHMEGGIAGTVTGTHHGSCRELRGMSALYCCRSPTGFDKARNVKNGADQKILQNDE